MKRKVSKFTLTARSALPASPKLQWEVYETRRWCDMLGILSEESAT